VAQPIFFRGRKLTEGLVESLWQENRIVAKSVPPSRQINNYSCDDAFKRPENLAAPCERQHTAKVRRGKMAQVCNLPCFVMATCMVAPHLSSRKFAKELVDVLLIARFLASVARRVNSWRAIKRINFQTGIVRDDEAGQLPRCGDCLESRIFFEGPSAFHHFGNFRMLGQIADCEIRPENPLNLAGLVHIAGGDNELLHV